MASIMKNYSEHEQFIFNFSFSFRNMNNLRTIGTYVPSEVNVLDGMLNHLHGVHVDYDGGVPHIYDVASCHITELRGGTELVEFSRREMHDLLMAQMTEQIKFTEGDDNILTHLFQTYSQLMDAHPRSPYKYDFMAFLDNRVNLGYYNLIDEIDAANLEPEAREVYENDILQLTLLCVPPFTFE